MLHLKGVRFHCHVRRPADLVVVQMSEDDDIEVAQFGLDAVGA
jgi:hypothetical protein